MTTTEAPSIEVVDISPTIKKITLVGDSTKLALYERRHGGDRQSLTWPTEIDAATVAYHMLPALGGALRLTVYPSTRLAPLSRNRVTENYRKMLQHFRGDDGMRFANDEEFTLEAELPNAGDGTFGYIPKKRGDSDPSNLANVQVCLPVLEHPVVRSLFEQTAMDNFRPLFNTILSQL